ncbi:MAG: toprim domain-containing protein, partial [Hyphomicrobiales bacterium]|nr:toprim domain-containing protein [Hyphomicrobiales bacterium]
VARDNDPAGDRAMTVLIERASAVGIEAVVLTPRLGDFNEDLRLLGFDALAAHLRLQVASEDVARFMSLAV